MHNLQVYKVKAGPRLVKLRNEQEDFLFCTTFKVGCIHMPYVDRTEEQKTKVCSCKR